MWRVLSNISCDFDPRSRSQDKNYFLVNASTPHATFGRSNLILCRYIDHVDHIILRVLGSILSDLDPKQGQRTYTYFLLNH